MQCGERRQTNLFWSPARGGDLDSRGPSCLSLSLQAKHTCRLRKWRRAKISRVSGIEGFGLLREEEEEREGMYVCMGGSIFMYYRSINQRGQRQRQSECVCLCVSFLLCGGSFANISSPSIYAILSFLLFLLSFFPSAVKFYFYFSV